jgi:hypothetical protein
MQIVTVKKICECVPISRSAFYSYYSDIYSLFEEIQNNLISDLFELNKNFPDTNFEIYKNGIPIDCFDETLKYIKENKKYFTALLGEYSDSQFIYKWKKIIKYHFGEKYKKEFPEYKHIDLVIEQIATSIIGAYSYWIKKEEITLKEFKLVCIPKVCFDFLQSNLCIFYK